MDASGGPAEAQLSVAELIKQSVVAGVKSCGNVRLTVYACNEVSGFRIDDA